jgi:hypothetical protein
MTVDPNLFNDIETFLSNGTVPWPNEAPVSQEEWVKLIESAVEATDRPLTEEEALGLLRWAENIRVGNSCLEMVLNGLINVIPNEEDVHNPSFKISEEGKEFYNARTEIS